MIKKTMKIERNLRNLTAKINWPGNRMRMKNNLKLLGYSLDAEKVFDKIQHAFLFKKHYKA